MIAFVSLFLGLIVGVVPVTVLVERPVAAVRYELDGKAAGLVAGAPWSLPLDFGAELVPHEIVAHALDAAGKEIGVARQFVNLPRPPAEVEVVLERNAKGRAEAARFSGQSLLGSQPARVTATFDGTPLPAPESDRVALPAYDDSRRHVLSIELEFTPTLRSRTDVVFGGAESGVVRSELTAVVVRRTSPGKTPEAGDLANLLVREGRPVPVIAVEEGPAIVCVQAGNVNTGACDPVGEICDLAHEMGAWVHVDGAFGLWAAVSHHRKHLVEGVAQADSWATDAHKWLNVPQDSGIAIVKDAEALGRSMSIAASYYPPDADSRSSS